MYSPSRSAAGRQIPPSRGAPATASAADNPESEWRRPFTPFEVPPRLARFQRALLHAYPESLRSAGIGGTVVLLAHIDESGRVLEARISERSAYESLDRTALSLVHVVRFTPALNRDRRVAVWVELPIEFRVRDDATPTRPIRPTY